MRLRTILFFIVPIVALPTLGWYFLKYKPSENTAYIAPIAEWKSILIGEWNFHSIVTDHAGKHTVEGKITINSNSTFIGYFTIKFFNTFSNGYSNEAYLIAGGRKVGTWALNDKIVELHDTVCNIELSYDKYNNHNEYDPCKENDIIMGDFGNNVEERRVIAFNRDIIQCSSHIYSSDGNYEIILKTIK